MSIFYVIVTGEHSDQTTHVVKVDPPHEELADKLIRAFCEDERLIARIDGESKPPEWFQEDWYNRTEELLDILGPELWVWKVVVEQFTPAFARLWLDRHETSALARVEQFSEHPGCKSLGKHMTEMIETVRKIAGAK